MSGGDSPHSPPHGDDSQQHDHVTVISKARERASAPGLVVASLHSSPDVELPHAATLGAVLPQGEQRLLLREGSSTTAPPVLTLRRGQCRAFSLPTNVGATVVASALSAHS